MERPGIKSTSLECVWVSFAMEGVVWCQAIFGRISGWAKSWEICKAALYESRCCPPPQRNTSLFPLELMCSCARFSFYADWKYSVCNHDLPPLEYFSFIKIFRLNKIAATPDWVKCLVIKVLKNETLNLLPKIFDLSRTVLKPISELGQSMAEKFGKSRSNDRTCWAWINSDSYVTPIVYLHYSMNGDQSG